MSKSREVRFIPAIVTNKKVAMIRTISSVTRFFSVAEHRNIGSDKSRFSVISKNKTTGGFDSMESAAMEAIRRQKWIDENN